MLLIVDEIQRVSFDCWTSFSGNNASRKCQLTDESSTRSITREQWYTTQIDSKDGPAWRTLGTRCSSSMEIFRKFAKNIPME